MTDYLSNEEREALIAGDGAAELDPDEAADVAFLAALLAPHPTVSQVREWADSVGPAFPLVFFLVHSIVTVAPFPRTVFTLSAGVLFGSVTGIAVDAQDHVWVTHRGADSLEGNEKGMMANPPTSAH